MIVQKRTQLKLTVPTASMGDLAFLLIIFFLLTSNFIKEAHVKLALPTAPDLARMRDTMVSVTMDEHGRIWLQGVECHPSVLENAVTELLQGRKERVVTVKIDKRLSQEQFGETLMALSKAGAEIALVGEKTGLD